MSSKSTVAPSFTIRPAGPADAAAVAALGERTFRDAFGAANTAENMNAYVSHAYNEAAQRRELEDPTWHTLLVEQDGTAIAFAQVRESAPPACVTGPAPIQLSRIYVDRGWHGQGIAQALMQEVIDLARRLGGRTLHLNVWEHNTRALAFYAKYGFLDVGEQEFQLGAAVDTDRILVLEI